MKRFRILTIFSLLCLSIGANAQYFGKNKPMYHRLDFEVLETPHFNIHHYLANREVLNRFADDAENWYTLHQAVLQDTFSTHNPVLLYNDHSDFQMTNAIGGNIGIGTGGVTEGLKNRLIMPLGFTNQQTHHVLGHEMVHAFQYNMINSDPNLSLSDLSNIPLWMVEGLAEYLSIGNIDPNTAMWMRDAVLNDDVPTIKDLNSYEYFPYRYGQAFWTFVTGTYGDAVVRPLFLETARGGLDKAIELTLGTTREELSEQFRQALISYYEPFLAENNEGQRTIGRKIISADNAGEMNISPSMSPNGRYLIFVSEKNLFTTDLYLATASGKILKRLTRLTRDAHLDGLGFIESSGAWSRDSKRYAFVAYNKGRNVIVIKEIETGKTTDIIEIEHIPAITNPAWSPDGKTIVFTGMVDGQTDLYSYTIRSGKVTQLTDDIYSEIQPEFNKEGTHLVFATDELSMTNGRTHGKLKMNIAVMNLESGSKGQIRVFEGADNLDPHFDHEGNILFLSDRDGFRNMYRYDRNSGELTQMTQFLTGISGITKYSPAISVSQRLDRIVYTHYNKGNYNIYQTKAEDLQKISVNKDSVDFAAGTLPVVNGMKGQIVQSNLEKVDGLDGAEEKKKEAYKPRFELDYLGGSAGLGVGSGTINTRAGLAGGIDLFFSDITGGHQLYSTLVMNGSFQNIGGQITYLNRTGRIAYGAQLSHIPQQYYLGYTYGIDTVNVGGFETPVDRIDNYMLNIYEEHAALLAELPFTKTLRVEGNLGATYRFYSMNRTPTYYYQNGGPWIGDGRREKVPLQGDEYNLGYYSVRKGFFYNTTLALVGDNSQFGVTAPMNGYRYRIEATKYFGSYDFWSTGVDLRGYKWVGPVSIAARFQHGARHGRDQNNFNPVFLGWQGFVHGYNYNQLEKLVANSVPNDVDYRTDVTVAYRRLSGSKYFTTGFEVRLPLTGPERLARIKSKFLLTDLNFFFDAGTAFDRWSDFQDGEEIIVQRPGQGIQREYHKPMIAMSTGMSLRVNVFNAMILEPYMAYPLQKDSRLVFGLNFIPGW